MLTPVAESRLVRALVFCLALAPAAATAETGVWAPQEASAKIAQDPWAGGEQAVVADDAYVFAEIERSAGPAGLDPDVAALAAMSDRSRLAAGLLDAGAPGATVGRVAAAFDSFVSLGSDGLAYASAELVRNDAIAAARAGRFGDLIPARFAMRDAAQ